MSYVPRYESSVVSSALSAAEARLRAAQDLARAKRGLPPLADGEAPARSDGVPLQARAGWGLKPSIARLYAILVGIGPAGFAAVGRAYYGQFSMQQEASLRVQISTLRTALEPHGIVIPHIRDAAIGRPYLRRGAA